jgi:hypothetical protein
MENGGIVGVLLVLGGESTTRSSEEEASAAEASGMGKQWGCSIAIEGTSFICKNNKNYH